MEENKDYHAYRYGDHLTPGLELKIEHSVVCENVDIQRPFCVAKCLLGNPKPLNCIVPMQAARFTKRSFSTPQECAAITEL